MFRITPYKHSYKSHLNMVVCTDQRGATLPEFALVIPALLLVFFLIAAVARPISHIQWANLAVWSGSLAGANAGQSSIQSHAQSVANLYYQHENKGQIKAPNWQIDPVNLYTVVGGTGKPILRVSASGLADPLATTGFTSLNPRFRVSMAAPYLVNGITVPNPNIFQNPTCAYTCGGSCVPTSVCSTPIAPANYDQSAPLPNTDDLGYPI